jgi:hypothetical protein
VLGILGFTARCHTCSIFLLLISSIVQGLTPAQQSLASSWGLVHFFSIQDFSDPVGDQDYPSEEDCVSTEPEHRPDLHPLAGGTYALSALIPKKIQLPSLSFPCPQISLPSSDHLSIILCRFTC